jgi:hypothetical protein
MWHAWRQVRRTGTQLQSENHRESDNFVDLHVDGRVIFRWLRIRSVGVLLRTLQRKFGIRNWWDVFGAAGEVLRLGERVDFLEGVASDVSKDPTILRNAGK